MAGAVRRRAAPARAGARPRYGFAALVEEGGHCRDPGAYVAALVALARRAAARSASRHGPPASGSRPGGCARCVTETGEIAADRAVIAPARIRRRWPPPPATALPLESERGYHAMIEDPGAGPRTPLMPSDGKMSITWTDRGLRCAGQVEIAGHRGRAELEARRNPARPPAAACSRTCRATCRRTRVKTLDGPSPEHAGRAALHRPCERLARYRPRLRPWPCRAGRSARTGRLVAQLLSGKRAGDSASRRSRPLASSEIAP